MICIHLLKFSPTLFPLSTNTVTEAQWSTSQTDQSLRHFFSHYNHTTTESFPGLLRQIMFPSLYIAQIHLIQGTYIFYICIQFIYFKLLLVLKVKEY